MSEELFLARVCKLFIQVQAQELVQRKGLVKVLLQLIYTSKYKKVLDISVLSYINLSLCHSMPILPI